MRSAVFHHPLPQLGRCNQIYMYIKTKKRKNKYTHRTSIIPKKSTSTYFNKCTRLTYCCTKDISIFWENLCYVYVCMLEDAILLHLSPFTSPATTRFTTPLSHHTSLKETLPQLGKKFYIFYIIILNYYRYWQTIASYERNVLYTNFSTRPSTAASCDDDVLGGILILERYDDYLQHCCS